MSKHPAKAPLVPNATGTGAAPMPNANPLVPNAEPAAPANPLAPPVSN